MYGCGPTMGTCAVDPKGTFKTLAACSPTCSLYSCSLTTGKCAADAKGTQSQAACTAACTATPPTPAPTPCTKALDVLFLVDASSSIGGANFAQMRAGMAAIAGGLVVSRAGVHVAAYTFSSSGARHRGFGLLNHTDGTAAVQAALQQLPDTGGATYTGEAISWAMRNVFTYAGGARPSAQAQPIMIIVTDGKPDDGVKAPADAAKAAGLKVMCIGVGGTYDEHSLEQMASTPFKDYIYGLKSYDPSEIAAELVAIACGNTTAAAPAAAARR